MISTVSTYLLAAITTWLFVRVLLRQLGIVAFAENEVAIWSKRLFPLFTIGLIGGTWCMYLDLHDAGWAFFLVSALVDTWAYRLSPFRSRKFRSEADAGSLDEPSNPDQ